MTAAPSPRCRLLTPANWLAARVARLPQPWLLRLGAVSTWLLAPLLGRRRRYARRNLALCFPELDAHAQRRLLRATLRATVTGVLESLRAWFAPAAALRGLVAVEGLEHLAAARADGRGVLLLTGHMPHLELGGRLLSETLGAPIDIVVRHNNRACLERFIDAARRRAFAATIGKKDVRGLLRALSQGRLVAYAGDQDFSYQHAFVPFFGVPAATLAAIPQLAARGNASVLPYWCQREADGRYRLRIGPPWRGWPSGDAAADAARYMAELERVVRRHPEQYLWVHRRFKTRPPGQPDLYA
ncbi:lysophospholipid acyltransferase family protein [Cognatiluteimonas weifangensis]|uniref:lysophospholipid acyltransferase family protein n=1 Tax=Cognatiluteimonas weifangensis TaxID=2303539 RepID=UPI00131400E0|nr:lysophospholipid acyltransferase family protein [Luteimonas weifangensis]